MVLLWAHVSARKLPGAVKQGCMATDQNSKQFSAYACKDSQLLQIYFILLCFTHGPGFTERTEGVGKNQNRGHAEQLAGMRP